MPQGVELATAYVSLVASASGISRSISDELDGPVNRAASDAGDRAGRGFGSTFGRAVSGIGGAIAAIGIGREAIGFVTDSLEGARESARIGAITAQVIESTGGAANVSAAQVGDFAQRLSGLTGVDDELIQSGQNMLLTFTNVRNELGEGNDVFDRATGLANDMSAALGQDMSSSAMQLGKALNNPIQGVSALQRVGISFTESQREQIATLQESGDMLGAQRIILDEVGRQFGGTAAAVATPMDRLKVTVGNLQEEFGARLIPVIDRAASWLADNLPAGLEMAGRALGTARDAVVRVVNVGRSLSTWMMEHQPILIGLTTAIGVGLVAAFVSWAIAAGSAAIATLAAAAPVIAIGLAIGALVAGIIWAYQNWDWFRNSVDAVANFLTNTLWPAIQTGARWITGTLVPAIGSVIGKLGEWGGKAVEIGATIGRTISDIVGWVAALPGRISSAASGMWNGIKDAFRSAINWIITAWNNLRFPSATFSIPHVPGTNIGGNITVGGWELPNITPLASGGIVASRPPEGMLARLGEGGRRELVAPLPNGFDIADLANGGGRTTTIENLNVYPDDPRGFYNETLWRLAG